MTVPTDHAGLEVLGTEECDRLLASQEIGRLAFIASGEPVVLPVNYRYHEGRVVFRTATGAKLEAATHAAPVAFEIDGWDEVTQRGWSVLIRGIAEHVVDPAQLEQLRRLRLRPWARTTGRHRWIRIRPDEISGRRIP